MCSADISTVADARVVLVTRPPPGAIETARRLSALGWQPIAAPCLDVAPRPVRLPAAGSLAAILVTSGQAVGGIPASHHAVRLLAVGEATAARARAAGFSDVRSADGDAAALAALARSSLDPAKGRLLLASGARQGLALAAELRAAGFAVIRRVVYAATPAHALPVHALDALAAGQVRAVMFFSAETARAFSALLPSGLRPTLSGADALAIGWPAASALRHLPWQAVRVALRPTQDEMFALLP